MGVNAQIFIKAVPNFQLPELLASDGLAVRQLSETESVPKGATHQIMLVEGNNRYFGLFYKSGDWVRLHNILMAMLDHHAVESVWYGGDDDENCAKVDEYLLRKISESWKAWRKP